MSSFTAWITTDTSCLAGTKIDVVVFRNNENGISIGSPVWTKLTSVDVVDADTADFLGEAKTLLANDGWTTTGPIKNVPTGHVVDVERL